MNTTEVITGVIAIYGALLSTATFVLHNLGKRQRVKVKLYLGVAAAGPSKPEDIVVIEAANIGSIMVHLSNCCIRLPDGQQFIARFRYDKSLPISLSSGESVQAFIASEIFIKTLEKNNYPKKIEVRAEFSNKAGKVFRSKKQKLDLEGLLYAKEHA